MGVLAESIQNNHGNRTIGHAGQQHKAVAGLIGKAGFGQFDIPVVLAQQVVGIAETQGVGRFAERHRLLLGGAQFTEHRVFACRHHQLGEVACGGYVVNRQAGRFDIGGMFHAQCLGLGIHRQNERGITTGIAVRQARRSAVFRRHQGDQQHVAAVHFAAEFNPGEHTFHFRGLGDIDRYDFVHRLFGIKDYHRGHQFGDRGNRYNHVRITGVQNLVGLQVDDHCAA